MKIVFSILFMFVFCSINAQVFGSVQQITARNEKKEHKLLITNSHDLFGEKVTVETNNQYEKKTIRKRDNLFGEHYEISDYKGDVKASVQGLSGSGMPKPLLGGTQYIIKTNK